METELFALNIAVLWSIGFGVTDVPRFLLFKRFKLNFAIIFLKVLLFLLLWEAAFATAKELRLQRQEAEQQDKDSIVTHSCIHDQIIEQRRRPGRKVYSVAAQVYVESSVPSSLQRRGRALLGVPEFLRKQNNAKKPIRIYLNYDAVGHSSDRDCRSVGGIVKLGGPNGASFSGVPSCNPHGDPPIYGDCWYNCTLDDITGSGADSGMVQKSLIC